MRLHASGQNGEVGGQRRQPALRIPNGMRDAMFFAAAALAGAGTVVLASPEPRLVLDSAGNIAGPTCIQPASTPAPAHTSHPATAGTEPAQNP